MSKRIAVVEDEPAMRANYLDAMMRQGYRAKGYASRRDALSAFAEDLPDLVIIDVGLADEPEGGFELCRELRSRSATLPLVFLTARDEDIDVVTGLRLGADDYLGKSVSLVHLSARVAALFRRVEALRDAGSEPHSSLHRAALILDVDRLQASWNGTPLSLTVTELWMLHGLVRYPGHVKSRQQLMEIAKIVVDETTVTSHVKRIRHKFLALDAGFSCIETVYGAGYRWTCT
jgi:two-component system OmpR family response regulator